MVIPENYASNLGAVGYKVTPSTACSRWIIGAAAGTQMMALGNLLIFNNAIDRDPYTVQRVFSGLKARHGLV